MPEAQQKERAAYFIAKTELAVDLPHPRHYTIKTSPEFMDLKARLTEEIRAESMAADLH
eukprot:gene12458-12546_t